MVTVDKNKVAKTALITGAASGIGYELARIFAINGYNLILVDINGTKLTQVVTEFIQEFGITVKILVKDLSIATVPHEIFTAVKKSQMTVDILVNNAGFGNYGLFQNTDLKTELAMMQVNMVCLTHLTKLFLPDMIQQGEGKILNVASAAAFQPGPLMAVYFATKAYILSFSEAVNNELEGTGVTITVLCPGPTQTAFHQRTGLSDSELVKRTKMMDAKSVADIGYHSLMTNKTVVIPGLKHKVLAASVRLAPRKLVTKIVRNMQEIEK